MTDLNDELTAVLDKEVAILERSDFRELDDLIADKERLIDQVLEQNVSCGHWIANGMFLICVACDPCNAGRIKTNIN